MSDTYWLFVIPGLILGMYAQFKLMGTYNRYVRVPTARGMTGAQAARVILDSAGLHNMPVNEVGGRLTDHYDPTKKALFLSSENYRSHSIAAVGVAAHEAGHALQHKAAYGPLQLRMTMVPVTRFASFAYIGLFLLGLAMNATNLIVAAIVVFAIITLFQIITLPVEYDASRRAKAQLLSLGLVHPQESSGISKVLNAAALTYVASMITSVLTLLHLITVARSRD
jgi:Zn-dependent membrane protease YugP